MLCYVALHGELRTTSRRYIVEKVKLIADGVWGMSPFSLLMSTYPKLLRIELAVPPGLDPAAHYAIRR